jgi:hypothetical protein
VDGVRIDEDSLMVRKGRKKGKREKRALGFVDKPMN